MFHIEFLLYCLICFNGFNSVLSETSANPGENAKDYCQAEHFNVTCSGSDDVILMTYAQYGRMRTGSCVSLKGQIGCSIDVLNFFDRRCSGRRRCAVYVSDPELHKLEPCQKDYTAYLSAAYTCIKGTPIQCPISRHQSEGQRSNKPQLMPPLYDKEVKGPHHPVNTPGYLLSATVTDFENAHTGYPCSWRLVAGEGQKIRLILLSFGSTRWSNGATGRGTQGVGVGNGYQFGQNGNSEEFSYEIGEVKEPDSPRTVISTGGSTRETMVFESVGQDVTVKLLSAEVLRGLSPFVIRYEVLGCVRLLTPVGGWVELSGNVATVRCNHSLETWYLTCSGSQWIGAEGAQANCTGSKLSMKGEFIPSADSSFPYGILVVVAIGVALGVVIGGILLSFVAYYMKRQNKGSRYPVSSVLSKPLTADDIYQDAYKELNLTTTSTGIDSMHRQYCGGSGGRFTCPMAPQCPSSPYMGSLHHGGPQGRLVAFTSTDHPLSTTVGLCTCSEPFCSAPGESHAMHTELRDSTDGDVMYDKAANCRMNSSGVVL